MQADARGSCQRPSIERGDCWTSNFATGRAPLLAANRSPDGDGRTSAHTAGRAGDEGFCPFDDADLTIAAGPRARSRSSIGSRQADAEEGDVGPSACRAGRKHVVGQSSVASACSARYLFCCGSSALLVPEGFAIH